MKHNISLIKKVRLVSIGTFILLSAAFVVVAAAIITFKVSLITLVAGGATYIIATVAMFKLGQRHHRISSKAHSVLQHNAETMMQEEGGLLTDAKLNFFKTYGKYCKKLILGNAFEAKITLISFFDGFTKVHPKLRTALRKSVDKLGSKIDDIVVSSLLPGLKDFYVDFTRLEKDFVDSKGSILTQQQENIIDLMVKKCVLQAEIKDNKRCYASAESYPEGEIAELIRSCPNLEAIDLGYCITPIILNALPKKASATMFEIDEIYVNFVREFFKNRK